MTMNEIMKKAMELSPIDRARLIDILYSTFDDEKEQQYLKEWVAEAEERLKAYDNGKIEAEDYNEIKKQIK